MLLAGAFVVSSAGGIAAAAVAGPVSQPAQVGLGTATPFAVLAGSTVTNTGPSVINGDLGVSPQTAVTGFPPGTVNGTIHAADAVAGQAQAALTTAYNDAAGRAPDVNLTGQDLGGLTEPAGVYKFDSSAGLTGALTLNAQGNPDSVFIFQIGSTLTTASASSVLLTNGAQACHVFWQVGSSAT
ncbi:MAG: ice-binding family protein, partial [Mycobacteriales bacterium]